MSLVSLPHPLHSVVRGSETSFGGCQTWSADPVIRDVGCGVVAAEDLLIHLARHHDYPGGLFEGLPDPIAAEDYFRLAGILKKRYFPLIPRFGINGLLLAGGMNRYFRKYRIPLSASWGLTEGSLFPSMELSLRRDIPVILAVGPNFPALWQDRRLNLYTEKPDGTLARSCGTKAHYVTVTAMDDAWLYLSSWGRKYRISRREYLQYMHSCSLPVFSNILPVRPRQKEAPVSPAAGRQAPQSHK